MPRVCSWVGNGDTSSAWHELCAEDKPEEAPLQTGTALTGAWRMTNQARTTLRAAVVAPARGESTALNPVITQAYLDGSEITQGILTRFAQLLPSGIVVPPVDWYGRLLKSKYVKGKISKGDLTMASCM